MQSLLKISEAASLALHTMVFLAARKKKLTSNKDIAQALKVSEAHLAKVMQRLGRAGLVDSMRGPKGGFMLARPAERITLLDVYQATEGVLQSRPCLLGKPVCNGACILGDLLKQVGHEVSDYLSQTTLAALVDSFPDKEPQGQQALG